MYEKYFALLDAPCSNIDKVTSSSFTGDHLPLFQEGKSFFVDVNLTTKLARDEESAEMLDIILANRVFDLGYYNTEFGGAYNSHFSELARGSADFASWYDSKLKSSTTQKEKVIEQYLKRADQ